MLHLAIEASAILGAQGLCGHDDNRDVPPSRLGADPRNELEPIHFGHHQIKQY
jgi:hypothetical protein